MFIKNIRIQKNNIFKGRGGTGFSPHIRKI